MFPRGTCAYHPCLDDDINDDWKYAGLKSINANQEIDCSFIEFLRDITMNHEIKVIKIGNSFV